MVYPRRRVRWLSRSLFIVLTFAAFLAIGTAKEVWTGVERIVAVGDVHGDYGQFVTLLRSAGLIDKKNKWIGGKTHLVQTGDVPDRGPDSRKVLDLLMKLEKQARKAKGYVHALIGNHEAMNMYGDLRYLHPGEYLAFKTPKSQSTRDDYYEGHIEYRKQNTPPEELPVFDEAYRAKWEKERPLGYFEQRRNFAPDGKYGRWISKHNAIIKINDILFLHGGIGPKYAELGIREINKQVQAELRDFSKLQGGIVMDDEGPLWYRGFARHEETTESPHLEALLKHHQAKAIVLGHTFTDGTVIPRFQRRVILIDVGLSEHYGGRLACLLIESGEFYGLHRGKKLDLPADAGKDFLTYLEQAAELDPPPSPLGKMIQGLQAKLSAN